MKFLYFDRRNKCWKIHFEGNFKWLENGYYEFFNAPEEERCRNGGSWCDMICIKSIIFIFC